MAGPTGKAKASCEPGGGAFGYKRSKRCPAFSDASVFHWHILQVREITRNTSMASSHLKIVPVNWLE